MPQVLIRPMTAADVPAVAALEQTAPMHGRPHS